MTTEVLLAISSIAQALGIKPEKYDLSGPHPTYSVTAVPQERHANQLGTVSGGFFSAILDDTLGALVCAVTPSAFAVTLSINYHFLQTAKLGEILNVTAKIMRHGSRITYVEGCIACKGVQLVQASGVWMQRRSPGPHKILVIHPGGKAYHLWPIHTRLTSASLLCGTCEVTEYSWQEDGTFPGVVGPNGSVSWCYRVRGPEGQVFEITDVTADAAHKVLP